MTYKAALACAAILMAFAPLFAQKPKLPRADVPDVLAPPPANGPNLVVSKLMVHSVEGNGLGYTVEITNTGNQNASLAGVKAQAHVYRQPDGKGQKLAAGQPFSFLSAALAPGKSEQKVIKVGLSDLASYKSLCLVIDHTDALKETQEGDNDLCADLKPGIVVENIDLTPVRAEFDGGLLLSWKEEVPGVYYLKVKNNGAIKSAPSTTKVTVTRSGQTTQTIELATPAIAPYGTAQLSFKVTGSICLAKIQATCDSKNEAKELDESNNSRSRTITCED